MSASIEHINMRFENYPGGISSSDPTKYVFPSIRYFQGRNNAIKSWDIYVQGCIGNEHVANVHESLGTFTPIEITSVLFDRDPEFPFYCRVVVTTTIKEPSIRSVRFITKGSNIGRANQKTIFHQALVDAYSQYWTFAKIPRNYPPDSPHLIDPKINAVAEQSRFASKLIPPMLASNEDPLVWWNNHHGKIYIQRKLDGTRAMCSRFGNIDSAPVFYTRKNGTLEMKNLDIELMSLTAAYPSLVFDGEIYSHGMHLQEISGAARSKKSKVPINIYYHIYDIADLTMTFEERYNLYKKIETELGKNYRFVVFEPATVCESFDQANALYEQFKSEKYEGAILRFGPGKYEPSYNARRSEELCKWKPTFSSEFKCIGWAEGQGSARGKVATWTCMVTEISIRNMHGRKLPLPLVVGQTFGCSISATDEQKKEWFTKFSDDPTLFSREFEGRYCTVEFYNVSMDGKPLQPHWTTFVDDVDETLYTRGIEANVDVDF